MDPFREFEKQCIEEGEAKGRAEGRAEERKSTVEAIMHSLMNGRGLTKEQALNEMGIPVSERHLYN